MTRYPGGKGGAGVYQTILRHVPPHGVYIEPFAGGASVFRHKRRAARSVLVERCEQQASALRSSIVGDDVEIRCACGIALLEAWPWRGDEFVYADPPYLHATRSSAAIYLHELEDDEHRRLLGVLRGLPVPFALSGYRSAMYDEASSCAGWRRVDYQAMTRGGARTESLWMNYPAPSTIADPGYAGSDFRDRQRISRKAQRWADRFASLAPLERQAILDRLGLASIAGTDEGARCAAAVMATSAANDAGGRQRRG